MNKESVKGAMLISVQAGNSDNKLSQSEWAEFVSELSDILSYYEEQRHFFGGSPTWMPWQNVCFVCEVVSIEPLIEALTICRKRFRQDAVCVISGEARFV